MAGAAPFWDALAALRVAGVMLGLALVALFRQRGRVGLGSFLVLVALLSATGAAVLAGDAALHGAEVSTLGALLAVLTQVSMVVAVALTARWASLAAARGRVGRTGPVDDILRAGRP